ncbi:hypothetical protein J3E72DRAFT_405544 [Bipolaris maydis]|nr:hypothetical protein J3E72DRAFT_405544 [Bipolaris maydis]
MEYCKCQIRGPLEKHNLTPGSERGIRGSVKEVGKPKTADRKGPPRSRLASYFLVFDPVRFNSHTLQLSEVTVVAPSGQRTMTKKWVAGRDSDMERARKHKTVGSVPGVAAHRRATSVHKVGIATRAFCSRGSQEENPMVSPVCRTLGVREARDEEHVKVEQQIEREGERGTLYRGWPGRQTDRHSRPHGPAKYYANMKDCPECRGNGTVKCDACNGKGGPCCKRTGQKQCTICEGTGAIHSEH